VDPSAAGRGPGGSVAAVLGSRRSLSPWVGARWVRRRSSGALESLRRGWGPGGPFVLVPGSRGSRSPSRWGRGSLRRCSGLPKELSRWLGGPWVLRRGSWARWVRRAVRGARRRPSPWSGPGGSVTVARGPWIPFPGSGLRQVPWLRFGAPGGAFRRRWGPVDPLPRVVGPVGPSRGSGRPKASVPVVGARWVRRRGSGSGGSRRCRSWARWVRRAVRGARRRPSPWSGPGGSVPAGPGSRGTLVPRQGWGSRAPRGAGAPAEAAYRPSRRRVGASAYRRPRPLKGRFCSLEPLPPSPRGGLRWLLLGVVWAGAPRSAGAVWRAVRV